MARPIGKWFSVGFWRNLMETVVANPVADQAAKAGSMFASSEIDAQAALDLFARQVGTDPIYAVWVDCRASWVNGYVATKPQAKGNSADQAFSRFARRLNDSFGIVAPRATSEAAQKKAAERQAKAEKLASRYADHSTEQLTDQLRKAYELQAKNPTKKLATLKELESVVKARTKLAEAESRGEVKAARERLIEAARQCTDLARLAEATEALVG